MSDRGRGARAGLGLLLPLLLIAGCRYASYTAGDDRFLRREVDLHPGASLAEITSALGPPDQVIARDQELVLLYRYQERLDRSVSLRYFSASWFTGSISMALDRGLILIFDREWRLKLASSQASQR